MAFKRYRGKTHIMWFPKTASIGYTEGDVVSFTSPTASTGRVVLWTSDTTAAVFGVNRSSVASTDTTTNDIAVEVPDSPYTEWLFDVDSDAGLVDSDVGLYVDVDTNSDVDRSSSVDDTVLVTARISASQGVGIFARTAIYKAGGTIA